MHELVSVTLVLRPRKTNTIPFWLGRAVQAFFYDSMRRIHPLISETVHDHLPVKPFTASNLSGAALAGRMMHLRPSQTLHLRYTAIHPHMVSILINGMLPIWLAQGIMLHDQVLTVKAFTIHKPHQDAAYARYEALLNRATKDDRIQLVFESPTTFKRTGQGEVADPDPGLVFGSLFARWNRFSSEALPASTLDAIKDCIQIESSNTKKHRIDFVRGQRNTTYGFLGQVCYRIHTTDSVLRQQVNALASFARYSGIGTRTTTGLGQARRIALTGEMSADHR